ncbi:MAG TPA: methyltransferase domain-containing protein [Solirubrobacterales bacterium]|jgi:SAM-dependent methyltransferase|nr:methyltransferase domain-containing protein [Solirubrobacterales bacterium]
MPNSSETQVEKTDPASFYVQRDQPDGVPPLELTGERTLPDVPEENYWYRRHSVVYEWISDRVEGRRVIDMACGEGYGSAILARRAAHVTGVDANPEAYEHAKAKYGSDRIDVVRELVETYREPADAVVFLQTIEHVQDPQAILRHFASTLEPGGKVFVSTPNLLTLAGPDAEKSDNPWHVKEYRAGEYREMCKDVFEDVRIYGLFHARKLRLHELAIKHAGWDRIHKTLRLSKSFYDRFTPAISERDFVLREEPGAAALDKALDFLAVCGNPRRD